jgi:hypothetical protein
MSKKDEQTTSTKLIIMSSVSGELVPFGLAVSRNAPITPTEERMVQAKHKEQLAIEFQKEKTRQAARCVSELNQQATALFAQDMSHHAALNEAAQGKPCQQLVEQFNDYAAKLEAQHLYGILEMGAHNIGAIVAQNSLLPDVPEPTPPKRTGLQRLLGG